MFSRDAVDNGPVTVLRIQICGLPIFDHFINCSCFFKVGQIMPLWTFLERENIVESRTGLHLSLPGLDVEIMEIKDW